MASASARGARTVAVVVGRSHSHGGHCGTYCNGGAHGKPGNACTRKEPPRASGSTRGSTRASGSTSRARGSGARGSASGAGTGSWGGLSHGGRSDEAERGCDDQAFHNVTFR